MNKSFDRTGYLNKIAVNIDTRSYPSKTEPMFNEIFLQTYNIQWKLLSRFALNQ